MAVSSRIALSLAWLCIDGFEILTRDELARRFCKDCLGSIGSLMADIHVLMEGERPPQRICFRLSQQSLVAGTKGNKRRASR